MQNQSNSLITFDAQLKTALMNKSKGSARPARAFCILIHFFAHRITSSFVNNCVARAARSIFSLSITSLFRVVVAAVALVVS